MLLLFLITSKTDNSDLAAVTTAVVI